MPEKIKAPQGEVQKALSKSEAILYQRIQRTLGTQFQQASENLDWLYANMHPYFFITMKEEIEAIVNLAVSLHDVSKQRKINLIDQGKKLIVARLDLPGSLYDTLKDLTEMDISYAEIIHSYAPIPSLNRELEIQRFEFEQKSPEEIAAAEDARVPPGISNTVREAMKKLYSTFAFGEFDKVLRLLWVNNPYYVQISPPERIARALWLYQQGQKHDGLYLTIEETEQVTRYQETRILFSAGNPQQKGFLTQTAEIFQRLNIGVRRTYCLIINTGVHPYFLGTFYVSSPDGKLSEKNSPLFQLLRRELYNTQLLSAEGDTYTNHVANRIMTGEEASLTNAFIAFCHTTLAHNQPDRFDIETVERTFLSDSELTRKLIEFLRNRFDPDIEKRKEVCTKKIEEIERALEDYNTGHRYLDDIRKTIFRTCVLFIQHTLKTNFFVPEKHALAFRLDPVYLNKLGSEFVSDLPEDRPFRVTFFFGRHGVGYHIGFSDIARGGWRTIISKSQDDYTTNLNTLFREVYVLAHTQHLKNKDIYEGGSKMAVVLNAVDMVSPENVAQRLYKLQYGFINAFLDLFVTENGIAKNPRVIDYYKDDEPIELGPDENMHDAMIEFIAQQSVKRGYILGIGIMSSKHVGINHKEYGVTSRGVIKFAEIAMKDLGIDMQRDSFSVIITGGTNGDVAGNAIRLLLERCPRVKILAIVAGSGALYDPQGANLEELGKLILKHDVVDFNPEALHSGGFILFRRKHRKDGLKELHKKAIRTDSGVEEHWITSDDFYRQSDDLIFSDPADLFLPCGGRPETINLTNWQKLFFFSGGSPSARVIVEGANSYITPEAREEIQKRGVIVLRDASANKCGVISSSYEIIANLLMTEKEFLRHKESYVKDVLSILDKRAEDEANLIFKRYRENKGKLLFTEISMSISKEINEYCDKLFEYFRSRPELTHQPLFQKLLLNHLPAFVRENPKYRGRVKNLPPKIRFAILASEIASSIVYQGGWEIDFESKLKDFLRRKFS